METTIASSTEIEIQKQELIDWIATINDVSVLDDLIELKRRDTFNFEEEFKKGITVEEARKISKEKIREWWGK
jgi:hypothetical protein